MGGGTTFTFVTDGPESALAQAERAAGDGRLAIAGGAATLNQYLSLGAIDELRLHVVPITLGAGERVFDGVGGPDVRHRSDPSDGASGAHHLAPTRQVIDRGRLRREG